MFGAGIRLTALCWVLKSQSTALLQGAEAEAGELSCRCVRMKASKKGQSHPWAVGQGPAAALRQETAQPPSFRRREKVPEAQWFKTSPDQETLQPKPEPLKELKAVWTLTIFPWDAWQSCVHPSLVDVSIKPQDINLVMLERDV